MTSTCRRITVIALTALLALAMTFDAGARTPSVTRLQTTASTVHPGQQVGLHGSVSSAPSGHTVRLQRRLSGSWRTVATARTTRYSTYWFTRTLRSRGSYTFRVVSVAGQRLNRSVSRVATVRVVPRAAANCTPGYRPCIPPGPDVDCAGGSGNGPRYVQGPVYVTGSDPYGLDSDGNGIGCQS